MGQSSSSSTQEVVIEPQIHNTWSLITQLGGKFDKDAEKLFSSQNKKKLALFRFIFNELEPGDIIDMHCHIVTDKIVHDEQGFISDKFRSSWNPYYMLKSKIFQSGAGVSMDDVNQPYVDRLKTLLFNFRNGFSKTDSPTSTSPHVSPHFQQQEAQIKGDNHYHGQNQNQQKNQLNVHAHAKSLLLAFDQTYDIDGKKRIDLSTFYTPNEYVWEIVQANPDYFYMAASVHPYRNDAVEELEKWAEKGVRVIKLLPNSMNVNLGLQQNKNLHPKLKSYFKRVKELSLILLVHVGDEHSVSGHFLDNALGNPLLLLDALNMGVRIIAAHMASEGKNIDFQNNNKIVPSIDLLMRLMRSPAFADILFADISAITMIKRLNTFEQIIKATDIHHRLVYGSDYPLPGVNLLIHVNQLEPYLREQLIVNDCIVTRNDQATILKEIYAFNPLLFDFAVKRLIKLDDGQGGILEFPNSCFQKLLFEKINNIKIWDPQCPQLIGQKVQAIEVNDTEQYQFKKY